MYSPHSKRKTTSAIDTDLGTRILYGRTSAIYSQKVKGHRVMKSVAGVGLYVDMTDWVSS